MLRVVGFRTDYRNGRDPVDMVCVAPMGAGFENTRTWHRVKKLVPPEHWDKSKKESATYMDMKAKWSVIGPEYAAWKDGQEVTETGTPLEAWAAVTPQMIGALKSMGIKSVEDVRDMGELAVSEMKFPNARKLPKLAHDYLSGADSAAKDERIAEMEERLAAMQELLEANQKAAEKPKRTRQRKETSEAA